MPKGLWLILPALFIDLAGAGISWALLGLGTLAQAATPVGAGIGGAIAGCSAGYATNFGFSALTSCIQGAVAGAAGGIILSGIGVPLAIVLGYAIQICLGLTFGIAFIVLPLAMMWMLYPNYLFFGTGKLVPILGWLPFWTAFVVACIMKKNREAKAGILPFGKILPTGVAALAAGVAIAPQTTAGRVLAKTAAFNAPVQQARQKLLTDIRPGQKNYESAAA